MYHAIVYICILLPVQQPVARTEPYGTEEAPYDASRYGPQCLQGGHEGNSQEIDEMMNTQIEIAVATWIYDTFADDLPLVRKKEKERGIFRPLVCGVLLGFIL